SETQPRLILIIAPMLNEAGQIELFVANAAASCGLGLPGVPLGIGIGMLHGWPCATAVTSTLRERRSRSERTRSCTTTSLTAIPIRAAPPRQGRRATSF